jgi:hypothetical protein
MTATITTLTKGEMRASISQITAIITANINQIMAIMVITIPLAIINLNVIIIKRGVHLL